MLLRETLDKIRSSPDPRDEENTKFQIIMPILGDLGWDAARHEIQYEYEVGGKEGGWVDIALMGPRRPVALIEAKRPKTSLGQHVSQMLRYAFYEGVDICALTTGLEWWLYLPREDGPPMERRFAVLQVREDPVDPLIDGLKTFLARGNLQSGEARKQAQQVLQAQRRAGKIEQDAGPPPPRARSSQKRTDRKLPTGFRLWGEHHTVSSENAYSPGIDLLMKVTEMLYQRHGKEVAVRLLNTKSTTGVPYASLNPNNRNLEAPDMGIYLYIYLNNAQACDRATRILEIMGHPSSSLEILYD